MGRCEQRAGIATMDFLDSALLEKVLAQLPPHALASAQMCCKSWSRVVLGRHLWRRHALAGVAAGAAVPAAVDWRRLCLHAAAAEKWRSGRLVLSSTLLGHSGTVTCVAALGHVLASGSADKTARLWDLRGAGRQLHVLQHDAPVVALALPSVSTCVTATRGRAHLWVVPERPLNGGGGGGTGGAAPAVRRTFDALPGGSITCLALADTQLLVGASDGTVQSFDLFGGGGGGRAQHITRHGSAVACMMAWWRPRSEPAADGEDWRLLVGTSEGQVSCLGCSGGHVLWRLPNRYPSRVVALGVQSQPLLQPLPAEAPAGSAPASGGGGGQMGGQRRQRRRDRRRQQRAPPAGLVVCEDSLLYVLNSRTQLMCWRVPEPAWADPVRVGGGGGGDGGAWPLSVCSLVGAGPAAPAARGAGGLWLLLPEFGARCVLAGSPGGLQVAALVQPAGCSGGGGGGTQQRRQQQEGGQAPKLEGARAGDGGDELESGPAAEPSQPAGGQPPAAGQQQEPESGCGGGRPELRVERLYPLHRLARRTRGAEAAGGGGSGSAPAADALCAAFTPEGRVVVGLADGAVCVLRFKAPRAAGGGPGHEGV